MQFSANLEMLFPELESPSKLLGFQPCASLSLSVNMSPIQWTAIEERETFKVLLFSFNIGEAWKYWANFYFAFVLAINGYVSDSSEILGFCQDNVVQWHFSSVGTHDDIVSVRLSGHAFLYKGKYEDVLNIFPMSGESVTVEMDNVGKWQDCSVYLTAPLRYYFIL